jgi:hypothetical protein
MYPRPLLVISIVFGSLVGVPWYGVQVRKHNPSLG